MRRVIPVIEGLVRATSIPISIDTTLAPVAAVLRAVLKARELTGSFDKPRYITFAERLCALRAVESEIHGTTTSQPTK